MSPHAIAVLIGFIAIGIAVAFDLLWVWCAERVLTFSGLCVIAVAIIVAFCLAMWLVWRERPAQRDEHEQGIW